MTQNKWDDEVDAIEDGVEDVEALKDPVKWVPLDRTKHPEDE